jgi:hypothetical protein
MTLMGMKRYTVGEIFAQLSIDWRLLLVAYPLVAGWCNRFDGE